MSNVFSEVSTRFQNSIIAIPVAIACLLGIVISMFAGYSDYLSSYWGYTNLPTMKVNEAVWAIALLPQVGQIIFATAFSLTLKVVSGRYTFSIPYFIIMVSLLLLDLGTDMFFKTAGFTMGTFVAIIAFVESLAIYTIGSEILMVLSFGLSFYMLPIAYQQLRKFFSEFLTVDSGSSSRSR